MTETATAWRTLDGVATAWFAASSLPVAAALAGRVVALAPEAAVDVRATGVRVRLEGAGSAAAASAAARDLGLAADPSVLQQVSVVLEASDPTTVLPWWQRVLGPDLGADGGPTLRVRASSEPRPLRDRIHLDVVRPAAVLEEVGLAEGGGPWGLRHADPDGTEIDLVPGDPLGGDDATADWQVVFAATACYRVTSATMQAELAAAAAALADRVGFPLTIDLRPGLVVLDSGKDQAERDAHGLDLDFADLAADLQSAARDLGAVADPALPRFAQVFLDAADVDAVRAFWLAALGYLPDRRDGVSDIVDPRRLEPVLVFQRLDAGETERLRQRNRLHVELAVPADVAATRIATAVGAGGRLLADRAGRTVVADPEGNELVVVTDARKPPLHG